jgi:hypothetical protein
MDVGIERQGTAEVRRTVADPGESLYSRGPIRSSVPSGDLKKPLWAGPNTLCSAWNTGVGDLLHDWCSTGPRHCRSAYPVLGEVSSMRWPSRWRRSVRSQELGGSYFDQRQKASKINYFIRRLERLAGGAVTFELQSAAPEWLFSRQTAEGHSPHHRLFHCSRSPLAR